jgi:acyl carrier protein
MTSTDTTGRVRLIFSACFNMPPEAFANDLSPSNFPKWDSTKNVDLILAIEKEFGFEFDLEEIGGLDSLLKIVDYVDARVAASA